MDTQKYYQRKDCVSILHGLQVVMVVIFMVFIVLKNFIGDLSILGMIFSVLIFCGLWITARTIEWKMANQIIEEWLQNFLQSDSDDSIFKGSQLEVQVLNAYIQTDSQPFLVNQINDIEVLVKKL